VSCDVAAAGFFVCEPATLLLEVHVADQKALHVVDACSTEGLSLIMRETLNWAYFERHIAGALHERGGAVSKLVVSPPIFWHKFAGEDVTFCAEQCWAVHSLGVTEQGQQHICQRVRTREAKLEYAGLLTKEPRTVDNSNALLRTGTLSC
jgi:hypothetical protein